MDRTRWTVTTIAGAIIGALVLAPQYLDIPQNIENVIEYIAAVGAMLGFATHNGRISGLPKTGAVK